ncbi:hypothetical protein A3Q56_07739, partial [Intoshia linei]
VIYQLNIHEYIKGLMCDTTAVNKRSKNSVFCRLKVIFPNIIYYPCRLHVVDRLLYHYIEEMFPITSSSPNSEYYFINTLRDQFDVLLSNYTTLDVSYWKYPRMNRNDYSELTLLIKSYIHFRTTNNNPNIKFKRPGPICKARWNSRTIYAIKYYMLTKDPNLRESCNFIADYWGPIWFQCRNDLTAIKKLKPRCNGKVLDCYERHLAIETQPLLNVEMTNEICERAFSSLEKFADRHLKDIATKFLIYVNKSFS